MEVDPTALAVIVGMAIITYATRAGGLWLMSRVRPSRRVEAWLRNIPGAVIISIIAPAALTGGPAVALAVVATAAVAVLRPGSFLLPIVVGVLAVWLLRMVF
jgi:uncharacterized membrane protein